MERESRKAYKLFRISKKNPKKLFPLYVFANEPVPMGKWLIAKEGEKVNQNLDHLPSDLDGIVQTYRWQHTSV